ncbi:hypothetical protein AAB988_26295 [Burkholderia contaminans]|uniref:hypothetical protein n=1 Tax=Burkholderia contaminans TaxID=488447 RepID=UPI003110AFD1
MNLQEIRKRHFGRAALVRSGKDFLVRLKQLAKDFLRASPLIIAAYLIWQHRTQRCGAGLVPSIRLFEKTYISPDAPNLFENFWAGFFYVCIAYYGFLFLHWIDQEIRTEPPFKKRWVQLLIRGCLLLATPLIFMNGRKYGWSDVSYGASMIIAVGWLSFAIRPAPTLAWLAQHYKTTIGAIAMSGWLYQSLAWKVRELQDSTFKLQSCARDAKGRAIEVSGHVTWAHAWPQLLVGLAGMAFGLSCVFFYWTKVRGKVPRAGLLSTSGTGTAGARS